MAALLASLVVGKSSRIIDASVELATIGQSRVRPVRLSDAQAGQHPFAATGTGGSRGASAS